jgi:DNA polymerase elongation subunit (family B)
MGIKDSRFHIKEDRFAKTTLFIKAKNSEEGAKKRYGQRIIRENGDPCDYILVKGFEYVRGNTSEITRKLQKEVIDYVLMDNIKEIIPRIQGIIKNINSRVYDLDQITIPINLSKPFGPSIKSGGEYYDGANWNNKYVKESIISGDLVRYFQAKTCGRLPYNKWVSYLDAKNINDNGIVPDYDWIINRSLKSPLESILSSAGISWDNIQGFQNMKDFFGE